MSPIKKAITEIRYRIPRQLLEKVFVNGGQYWRATGRSSMEEQIESLVIRPRVLVDCNLVGGTESNIPLANLPQEHNFEYGATTIIHIPKSRTNGLSINSVLNVNFYNAYNLGGFAADGSGMVGAGAINGTGLNNAQDNSSAMTIASNVVSAFDKIQMTSTARVSLIAENTIMIFDTINIPPNSYLRCILENDAQLNNIQLPSYPYFCNLVEYAVKAYIYNELIITIDTGELYYGQNLGAFKEIVSGYADSNQNYQDYLMTTWSKVAVHNDPLKQSRYIRMMFGGNH